MLKRILIVGVAAVALALVAPVIGAGVDVAHAQSDPSVTAPDPGDAPDAPDQGDAPDAPDQDDGSGCADGASAHASGEDCDEAPAQPAPQPQPAPTSEAPKKNSGGVPGSAGESRRSESTPVAPQVVQNTTPVNAGVDTGTIPQGGIQAGAGGTADDGSMAGLLWGGTLILLVAAGGLALRRRDGLLS